MTLCCHESSVTVNRYLIPISASYIIVFKSWTIHIAKDSLVCIGSFQKTSGPPTGLWRYLEVNHLFCYQKNTPPPFCFGWQKFSVCILLLEWPVFKAITLNDRIYRLSLYCMWCFIPTFKTFVYIKRAFWCPLTHLVKGQAATCTPLPPFPSIPAW
jgi:hypothetical protein